MTEPSVPPLEVESDQQAEGLGTETIDLTGLLSRNITLTGSFDLRGVQARALTKLLDSLPMAALLVDHACAVAFANEFWDKTIEDSDRVQGRPLRNFFPNPAQAQQVQDLMEITFADRKPRTRKLALNTRLGQRWGRMHLRSLRVGSRRYILVLYQDLTPEKEQITLQKKFAEELQKAHDELEEYVETRTIELRVANRQLLEEMAGRQLSDKALRESEANYRAIFDAANDAIFVHDAGTFEILDVNKKMSEIYGYAPEEASRLTWQDLTSDEPLWTQKDASQFMRRAAQGEPQLFEWMAKDKRGRSFWVEVNLKRAAIGGGDRLLAVVRDITERKLLEDQLRHAQKMEAVGRLAGGVAHDFNNTLTAVMGHSNLLLQQMPSDSSHRKRVEQILQGAERAARLTRQLLAFSRKQVLDVKVVDLNQVIAETYGVLTKLLGPHIPLITILDSELAKVRADRDQIEQILMNLASNARDAMPDGGDLIIETSNVALDESYARIYPDVTPGSYVMIAVSDTGHGMYSETVSRIFEPFFTTKDQGTGSGLGLSMVYGIVKQHRGHVAVRSEPGLGTTLKLYWPVLEEEIQARPEDSEVFTQYGGSETILLVEDEPSVLEMTCEILQMLGYNVLEAGDPEDATKSFEQYNRPIHLLLTDVVMPKVNGSVLYSRLTQQNPELKVLYVSGYTENAIVRHGVLKPGVNFLQKPFTALTLARKVREVLDAS
ncbi:MAG: PAS domain S-box protein [Desulfomonile tiedjei]|nr:PAS domain S-box protein [Desulfomonile tiedjei]